MKRWLLAVAVLIGWTVSQSYADFVLIRAVLGGKRDQNNQANPGAPGGPGTPPGPGGPPGRPPPPGAPGGPGGGIPNFDGGQSIDTAALAVQAVVPMRDRISAGGNLIVTPYTKPPKGVTRLFNDGQSLMAYKLPLRSNKAAFEARKAAVFKNRTSDKVLDLADWALTHGLVDEFAKLMDDLIASKDDQSPSASEALKRAVAAYKTVKDGLAKPVDREDTTQLWKGRLQMRYEQSPHFTLFYTSPTSRPPEVDSRLNMLEQHLKAFYYWFAMKGIALPMPAEKLVCVLLDQPDEFKRQRAIVEDEPLVADSFFAHRDGICVFSKERLDGPFQVFIKQTAPIYQSGMDRQSLLEGTARTRPGVTINDLARFQTLALLEKALEEEGERAAVSHDGTRQLLVASSLVPRNVVVPQWAMFGVAAFFETPKGPFPGAPLDAQVAFYPGVGAPSWMYLRPFKKMDSDKKFPSEAQLLREVVTDQLFHRVINASDKDGLLKARTTAWALAYFLAKTRLPGLIKYFEELSRMPRDLELNDQAMLAAFARAFDVANAAQDGIDPQKFEELAKAWVAYMRSVALPGAEFGLGREQGSGTPGAPGSPGSPTDAGGAGGPSGGPSTPPKGGGGRPPGGGSGS